MLVVNCSLKFNGPTLYRGETTWPKRMKTTKCIIPFIIYHNEKYILLFIVQHRVVIEDIHIINYIVLHTYLYMTLSMVHISIINSTRNLMYKTKQSLSLFNFVLWKLLEQSLVN